MRPRSRNICSAPNCQRKADARYNGIWYCNMHYLRLHSHGDLELHPRAKTTTIIDNMDGSSTITTSKGDKIIIDTSDAEKVMRYSWCISKTGYVVANINNKVTKMHRYLLGISDCNVIIDHKNGSPLDNRRCNLRVCSQSENAKNVRKKKNNSSGMTGIRLTKHGMWNVRITVDRKEIHVGNYKTADEAIAARQKAELQFYGEFAPCVCRSDNRSPTQTT